MPAKGPPSLLAELTFIGPLSIAGPLTFAHCNFIGPTEVLNTAPFFSHCTFHGDLILPPDYELPESNHCSETIVTRAIYDRTFRSHTA